MWTDLTLYESQGKKNLKASPKRWLEGGLKDNYTIFKPPVSHFKLELIDP